MKRKEEEEEEARKNSKSAKVLGVSMIPNWEVIMVQEGKPLHINMCTATYKYTGILT